MEDKFEHLLRNEMDMCFRRRVYLAARYLELQPQDRVLDCGCGRGYFAHFLNKACGSKFTGIDMDTAVFPELAAHNSPAELQALRGSITNLPLRDGSYAKVVFSEVLEHLAEDELALREIFRVMAPGGALALTVPNHRYPFLWDPLNWILEALFNRPIRTGPLAGIWANHERLYTIEGLSELVTRVGFTIERTDLITYYCFPFAHNLVYGLGKELLCAGLLPKSLVSASDRYSYDKNSGSPFNPINALRRVFLAIDRLNDRYPPKKSSVLMALKLRKPSNGVTKEGRA